MSGEFFEKSKLLKSQIFLTRRNGHCSCNNGNPGLKIPFKLEITVNTLEDFIQSHTKNLMFTISRHYKQNKIVIKYFMVRLINIFYFVLQSK